MRRDVRSRLEMAARVREFLRAHPTEGAGVAEAVTRLDGLLTRGDELAAQQRAGRVARRAATVQRQVLRRLLQTRFLRHLIAVGSAASKDSTDLLAEFRLPSINSPHRAFLTAVKGMVSKAEARRELLLARGLSEQLLEEVTGAVAALETTFAADADGRRAHVGATADLHAISAEIHDLVEYFDGLVRYRFGADAERMAAWRSARSIVARGRRRGAPVAGDGVGPSAPGGSDALAA